MNTRKRKGWALLAGIAAVACPGLLLTPTGIAHMAPDTSGRSVIAPARWIIPGKQVASIAIGGNPETVIQHLGPAQAGDGAMGRYTSTWISKSAPHYRLDVYSHRLFQKDGKEKVVVQTVRVESPYFRMASGIRADSPWSTLRARYPEAKPVAHFRQTTGTPIRRVTIYDDVAHGVGFEHREGAARIHALYIHTPGETLQPLAHDDPAMWKSEP